MGLIEDFATWTEKLRRKLLRESGSAGRDFYAKLPPGVPVTLADALEFVDALCALNVPDEIRSRARRWKDKLSQT